MTPVLKQRISQFFWVAAFVVALLAARVFDVGLFSALRGAGFDQLQRVYPRVLTEPQPVRVVDIDEASLKALGQWPWSRSTLAKLVEDLHQMGAAAIAFDIVFPEPDRLSPRTMMSDPALQSALPPTLNTADLPDTDAIFAAALSGKPTILAFASSDGPIDPSKLVVKSGFAQTGAPALEAVPVLRRIVANLPILDASASGIGGFNIDLAGEQGIARQIPLLWSDGTRFAPSLSVEALRVAQGADTMLVNAAAETENALESLRVGEIEIPVSESGMFYVHYRPNPLDLYVSAADVMDAQKREALRPKIEGNIVFIGTSAVGLLDIRTTALGENVAGVSIHAQAVEQMLTGRFLTRPEWAVALELILFLVSGLTIAAVGSIYRPFTAFGVTALLGTICVATTLYGFKVPGILFDATFPVMGLILTSLASTAYRLVVTDRDGRTMRRMFGHYVAPSVLDDIERNPQNLKLGGEVRDITVMFVDVANFTPLGEKLSPQELVQTINGLWNVCTKEILQQQGTIDKFIGDAIMAFWNAPVAVENHQFHAAKAALAIRKAVAAYGNDPSVAALLEKNAIPPITLRIGLASGPACVGNMGSSDRFDYTVIGETVNTAARTEATCKAASHDILIAGTLHPETKKLALLSAGHAAMKGKSQNEPIHALIGDEAEASTTGFLELQHEHDHLVAKMVDKPTARANASIKQLLDEVALHHPVCASYLRAIVSRSADYVKLKPTPGRG